MQEYQKGTQCLHAGYVPESGEPRNIHLPLRQQRGHGGAV